MLKLGKIIEIEDLRTVWPHEALDFTPWLAQEENLSHLGDVLGLDISLEEMESSVGSFNADIVGIEEGTGKRIVIENQLESTNHDHLGKLITFAAGKSANILIWIVKRAREEHKAAIEWLNNHTDEDVQFFLVELKLLRIGNSDPAVKFEIIEQPNNWTKEAKKSNQQKNTNSQFLFDYWEAFNDYASQDESFNRYFKIRKPNADHWLSYAVGSSKYHIDTCIWTKKEEIQVEFYIRDDKSIYHSLLEHKHEIEDETGIHLYWQELPTKKASRISTSKKADLQNRDDWTNQFKWMITMMIIIKTSFLKYI